MFVPNVPRIANPLNISKERIHSLFFTSDLSIRYIYSNNVPKKDCLFLLLSFLVCHSSTILDYVASPLTLIFKYFK